MSRFSMKNILWGVYGGLVGGIVFGILMAAMGMMPMIGQMVGVAHPFVGFIVHLIISIITGALFAILFMNAVKSYGSGIFWGFVYGVIWWFLGPLTLMPLFLGMGLDTSWTAAALSAQIPSLIGHIIFGVLLGCVYAALKLKKSKKLVG